MNDRDIMSRFRVNQLHWGEGVAEAHYGRPGRRIVAVWLGQWTLTLPQLESCVPPQLRACSVRTETKYGWPPGGYRISMKQPVHIPLCPVKRLTEEGVSWSYRFRWKHLVWLAEMSGAHGNVRKHWFLLIFRETIRDTTSEWAVSLRVCVLMDVGHVIHCNASFRKFTFALRAVYAKYEQVMCLVCNLPSVQNVYPPPQCWQMGEFGSSDELSVSKTW